jgi:hypothetical protein
MKLTVDGAIEKKTKSHERNSPPDPTITGRYIPHNYAAVGELAVRLTLRTLLAYLDDTLEPAQAKTIGQKIAESPTAQELIDRIKEVVRRRRLLPPPAKESDAKLDSNTIAEYIDSVLPADQLAAVEETCLDSDVYLAEIAACHQILTIILSEPALVPPTAKQRMYGLIQGPEAIPHRQAGRIGEESLATAGSSQERDDADDALLLGLPLYRGRGPWYRRFAPVAGVLLLAVGLALAIWKALPNRGPANKPASDGQVARNGSPSNENTASTRPNAHDVQPTKSSAEDVKPAKPDAGEVKPSKPAAGESKSSNPPAEDTKPPKPAVDDTKPTPQPVEETKPTPVANRPRKAVGKYSSPAEAEPDVLLQRVDDKAPWKRLRHNDPVSTEDYLVVLPGYRSRVQLDRGVDLTMWGGLPNPTSPIPLILDSAAVLHDASDVDLDLTLDHGRVTVANSRPGSKRVRVHFHDESCELTLDGTSEAAMELWGKPELGFTRETKRDGPEAYMGLFVLKGQIQFKIRYDTYSMREPKGPALFVWSNVQGNSPGPQLLNSLPPWAAKPGPANQPTAMVQALRNLSKQLKGQVTVDVALAEMVNESPGPGQLLGIYSLAAIQDLGGLLEALADEHHATARAAAIVTLRYYLGQQAGNDLKLYQALEKRYRSSTAETIMVLIHGYPQESWTKPETYEQLIEYLLSDKLPIRELANWNLSLQPATREIAQKIPYDPAGGQDQRVAAHDEWKKYIPDGKLPTKGPPTPSNGPKKKDK